MIRRFLDAVRRALPGSGDAFRWDSESQALHAEIGFRIEVMEDELDGGYVVHCLNLPGCMSQGETVEEAFDNIGEAIGGVLAARFERNLRDQEAQIRAAGGPHPHELTVPVDVPGVEREHVPA